MNWKKQFKQYPYRQTVLSAVIGLLFFRNLTAQTQWTADGIFFIQSTPIQINLAAVPDGRGGAFIAYEESASGDANIMTQWIDGSGVKRWGASGVSVASGAGDQKYPAILPDGSGGAFIAWFDKVSGYPYIQHVNASGIKTFAPSGIIVSTADSDPNTSKIVKIATDGGTGAILVWSDKRNGTTTDLFAQKYNNSGTAQWTSNGVTITTAPENQSNYSVQPDGSGGVFVVWDDYRSGTNNDIYAQRLNASGAQSWLSNGVSVCNAANNQLSPNASISGNKLIIGWQDSRTGTADIYAQALDFNGTSQWTTNGVAVCGAAGNQTTCRTVDDGSSGAILSWTDTRAGYDIYAQRLNTNGSAQWTANGIPVNVSANIQYSPEMTPDGAGGAVVAWLDYRNGANYDLYAQHVNASGSLLWASEGLPVSVKPQNQLSHLMVSDGSGGSLVFWLDGRDARYDVYGQSINDNIALTAPGLNALWAGDRSQTIQWTFRTTQTKYNHLEVKASQTPGDGFPISISAGVPPAQTNQTWTAGTVNSTTVRIKVQAVNDQGKLLGEYFSPLFTVDSNPPDDFSLVSPTNGSTTDVKPAFQWNATTDAVSGMDHYELWINSLLVQDNIPAASISYTLTEAQKLPNGSYIWAVKAVDKAGLIRPSYAAWSCTASDDMTPPSVFHLLSPANNSWTLSTTPLLTWQAATDAGKGMQKYQLYVNGGLAIDNINPSSTSVNAPSLAPGTHSWYVMAVDQAGNPRQSAETWNIKIDTEQPAAFSLTAPANSVWLKTAKPAFSWTASSDALSGLSKYQLFVDGNLKIDNLPSGSTSVTLSDPQALTEGTHTWYVTAADVAGNTRTSSTFTVKIDVTAPQNFALTAPPNGSYVTLNTPSFSWQTATDPVSGIKEYQLILDGSTNKTGITGTSTAPSAAITEGSHSWTVKAVDNADNGTTPTAFNFTADWTPPNAFSLIGPAAGSVIHNTNKPKFTWRKTGDAGTGFDLYQLYLNNVLKQTNSTVSDTSVTLSDPLSNGNYTWKVVALDKAGNQRSVENTFTIQCNAPNITSPATADATEDLLFSYPATATDPDGDPVTISFENLSPWLQKSGNIITGRPNENDHTGSFDILATDGLFTTTKTVTIRVAQVNDPPDITSPVTASTKEHETFTYPAAATDPDGPSLSFTFKNYPTTWLTPSGSAISGTVPEGASNFTFDVIAFDGTLKDSVRVAVGVTPVNDPPVFKSASHVYASEDVEFVYIARADDPEASVVYYTFKNVPYWLSVSGNIARGTPTDGTPLENAFDIIASDGSLTDTLHVLITINSVNDPPQITSPMTADATEHQPFSYTAAAFDPEESVLTYTYLNYPAWLTPSGQTISGTPGEGVLSFTFDIKVSDGELPVTRRVTVTVTPVNDPPEITSPATANATEQAWFTYTAKATDPENHPLTYSFQNVPYWLYVSGQTISGTPREGILNATFTFSVTDGVLSRSRTVTLNITSVNDPPVITSPESVPATEHVPFTYTATAFDSEGDPLTYSFQNLSSWLLASGKNISGTPGEGVQSGSFDLSVSDGKLSTTRHIVILVSPINDPPAFTSSNNASATEDIPFTYTPSANDPEKSTVTFTFQNLSAWLNVTGQTITGTPGEEDHSGEFDVVASDGSLTTPMHVVIAVTQVNDPPEISSPLIASTKEHEIFTYNAAANDPDSPTISFTYKNYPTAWLTKSNNTLSGKVPEGTSNFTFDLVASDGSLKDSIRVAVNVTPVNDPPVFTSPDTSTATEDAVFSYIPSADDPEKSAVTFTFQNKSPWLNISGKTITGTPGENDHSGYFEVVASDGTLTQILRVRISVIQVNDSPVITSAASMTIAEHSLFTYTPTVTDPDNIFSDFTFTFTNFSNWLTPGAQSISGRPGEGVASGAFDVMVSDGQKSDTKHVSITVTPVNDPPYFTSKDTASATEHKPFTYKAEAKDPESASISYAYLTIPSWLKVLNNQINGTPEEANHDTLFTVVASDGLLKDTLVVKIKVIEVNDPPQITSNPNAEATEGEAFSYKAAMSDPDGPKQSIRFTEYPDWMTPMVTPLGAEIGGTPPDGAGSTTFKVIAWDGQFADTLVVHVTVISVNDPPRFIVHFPKPEFQAREQLNWNLSLDDFVEDPDNPDSSLTWSYAVLDTQRISVSIHPKTHNAVIFGLNVRRTVQIVFTVSDPSKASAADTLIIIIKSSTGVASRYSDNAPASFTVYDNFPNPFNPNTVIRYGIPKPGPVRIEIYNMMGQRVAELVNERQREGYYEIQWNAADCPSGLYLCRIQTENSQKMKKMTLVK